MPNDYGYEPMTTNIMIQEINVESNSSIAGSGPLWAGIA